MPIADLKVNTLPSILITRIDVADDFLISSDRWQLSPPLPPFIKRIHHNACPPTQPENILLHSPGPYPRIQIADFGLARPRAYEETLHVCGTISYLPPEGVRALENKNLGYVGMPADCWSAGIVIFAMLTCAIFL